MPFSRSFGGISKCLLHLCRTSYCTRVLCPAKPAMILLPKGDIGASLCSPQTGMKSSMTRPAPIDESASLRPPLSLALGRTHKPILDLESHNRAFTGTSRVIQRDPDIWCHENGSEFGLLKHTKAGLAMCRHDITRPETQFGYAE
jgi:hypothetical protein